MVTNALIIDAVRTPRGIGKVGKGALANMHPHHLSATVLKALRDRNNFDTADVDDIIWSASSQIGKQGCDMGRMAALDAGYDQRASGVTLDRFCGGGISAVALAAGSIMSGMEQLVIAGGCEMMSYTATQLTPEMGFLDRGNIHLRDIHPQSNQGVCADAIAAMEGITREDVDALAGESQRRAAIAIEEGRFKSVVPVYDVDGMLLLDREEYPRPGTTTETLATLKPSFAALTRPGARSITPAIRLAWSTARRPSCLLRRITPESTA
jgi:acetyl-CoA C-acetyltransferase